MYEISRSKVFSPIVLLFDQFQKIAPEFLYKLGLFLLESEDDVQDKDTINMSNNNIIGNKININNEKTNGNSINNNNITGNNNNKIKNNNKTKTTFKYL